MEDMNRTLLTALARSALALSAGVLLSGCGSSQPDTVSVAETPPAATPSTTSTQTTSSTTTAQPSTTPAPTTTAGGTAAPSTTRTAPEPAFTQQETQAEGASAAAALVRARGFTPNDTSEYHENQTLRVLLGTRTGSADGYGQQAFFFLGGHYLGTDTKQPSATLKVLSQNDTEVTLAYPLYKPTDALSSPSGGQAVVHFQLNNGQLTPLGRIPPASSASGLSRN
jgi:LppP/LprE lipoprotein